MFNKLVPFLKWAGTIKGNFAVGILCLIIGYIPLTMTFNEYDKEIIILDSKEEIELIEEQLKDPNLSSEDQTQLENQRDALQKVIEQTSVSLDKQRPWIILANIIGFIFAFPGMLLFYSGFFRGIAYIANFPFRLASQRIEEEREKNQIITEDNRAKPAWDKAQLILEKYYDRNLAQVNQIFVFSVVVMTAGFILITIPIISPNRFLIAQNQNLEGIENSRLSPHKQLIPLAVISGVITEFIGATFLIIYRSTINQAIRYTESLERVNSVGMAIQILDSANDQVDKESVKAQKELIEAKIEIAKLLLERASKISDQ